MQMQRIQYSYVFLLLSFLIICFQVFHSFNYRINTDEFFFLSQIYEASRHELRSSLQTFHVHFFSWLPSAQGYEIEQITLGRLCMLLAEIVTAISIVLCAKPFVKIEYAIFAAFAWLCSGYTISDGASFRTDPLATALLMSALALSLSPRINILRVSIAGVLVSIACMVTIKSVLYAPAFLGAALWQKGKMDFQKVSLLMLIAAFVAIMSFLSLYFIHHSIISGDQQRTAFTTSKALSTGFLNTKLFPAPNVLAGWILLSLAPIYFMILAIKKNIITLCFVLPLFVVIFYRNSYPYFYPFITAPAFILVAIGAYEFKPAKLKISLIVFLAIFNLSFHAYNLSLVTQDYQRLMSKVIHDIFPEPINYIDQVSMLPTYPKRGFFMTTWGMQNYHDNNIAVMATLLENYSPPLLLANHKVLLQALGAQEKEEGRLYLFPEDIEALRSSYLKFWGPIYVAGIEKKLSVGETNIYINIAGNYKNESEREVTINGITYGQEETVSLNHGNNTFFTNDNMKLRLIWEEAGSKPTLPEPEVLELF